MPSAAEPRSRGDHRPAGYPDLSDFLPAPRKVQVNGIGMTYYEVGSRQALPVILLHGYPETAFSWRHQLRALKDAGRWAIAPDQRGYGLTDRPETVEAYDIEHLIGDLIDLIDKLDIERAIFCGHDWGGSTVWQMALRHPSRVGGIIALNTPFTPQANFDPIKIMRARLGAEMYLVHFQIPGEADAILAADVRRTMDFYYRRPSSGQEPSQGLATRRRPGTPSAFAFNHMIASYKAAEDVRQKFLEPAEFELIVSIFECTGFTGGINWCRNISRNWQLSKGLPERVLVPSLMIMAESDVVLPPSAADGMEVYVPDLEKVLVRGSGHWTHQERPLEVNAALLDWLARRFPS